MARLARNIYKRKDGRFEGRYVKSRDENGKAKYGSVFARTYAEVKEKLERAANSAPQNESPETVKTALTAYAAAIRSQIKPSTHDVYCRYIDNHIAPVLGDTRCDRLTAERVQGFADGLMDAPLSVATAKAILAFLKSGLKNAVPEAVFDVKLPKRPKPEMAVFSADEQKRLESAAKLSGEVDFLTVTLCLYTGIRIGEVCGLRWSDIDFESRNLHVRRTVQRIRDDGGERKTRVAILTPKSVTSARSIPLPDFLMAVLREHQPTIASEYILSRDGSPAEPRTIQYRFKNLLAAADVKEVNFHTTRHTFVAWALENSFDVKTLSEILGHASPVVTLNKYAHTLDEHKRGRMEALEKVYR
jgi:integrase